MASCCFSLLMKCEEDYTQEASLTFWGKNIFVSFWGGVPPPWLLHFWGGVINPLLGIRVRVRVGMTQARPLSPLLSFSFSEMEQKQQQKLFLKMTTVDSWLAAMPRKSIYNFLPPRPQSYPACCPSQPWIFVCLFFGSHPWPLEVLGLESELHC